MIKAAGITKSYGDLRVLKGIDLNISVKEVISIVGASGAGKTTLLQILGTLDNPDSGTIFYNGTDICKLKGRQLASFRNINIGFVFQFHQLLPEFTALENVCIPAYIAGKARTKLKGELQSCSDFSICPTVSIINHLNLVEENNNVLLLPGP
jgi:lipoprotein-releasing system ATP-binding protein